MSTREVTTYRLIIKGKVQGVNFRHWFSNLAISFGLNGYIQNQHNKDEVEAIIQGNINDILNMSVTEAKSFFSAVPSINNKLQTLYKVGLGYIKLGQQATTLSGGEAQRIKLAKELSKRSTGKTLYILDEPTTGLHFEDVKKLLEVLNRLVDNGNTVIVIEHNLDVIKCSDWIIDLGPEGGYKGGQIIAEGTPEHVSKCSNSYTGMYIKKHLNKKLPITG